MVFLKYLRVSLLVFSPWVFFGFNLAFGANSGGCICLGPDYLAYELANSEKGEHRLFLLDPLSDAPPVSVKIDGWQVSGMKCAPRSVKLANVDSTVSVIELKDRMHPKPLKTLKFDLARLRTDGFNCFGDQFRGTGKKTIDLGNREKKSGFGLRLVKSYEPKDGSILNHFTAYLVRPSEKGKSSERLLFSTTELETIDYD